jgi:uncharacterized Zn-binding protein involved in type VI secretion
MASHGIARVGVDTAGGTQLGGGQGFVRVGGALVAVLGDAVAGHGDAPHAAPAMAEGSLFARINGIPVCRQGHLATCGHATTGAAWARLSA